MRFDLTDIGEISYVSSEILGRALGVSRAGYGVIDTDAETITIPGAFVASSSSSSLKNATRGEVLTAKSLYCAPDADVQVGDRIRADGVEYYINVLPSADKNPFTGWRPASEIPLDNSLG